MAETTRRAAQDHARLGRLLRQLRDHEALQGAEAARLAGMSQSKISRLETCKRLPSVDDIQKLSRIYNAAPAERDELLWLVDAIRSVSKRPRVVLPRGAAQLQATIQRLESAASTIRTYSPGMVLGILQTPDYIRTVFAQALAGDDLEQAVAARAARRGALHDQRKTFHLVMSEGARCAGKPGRRGSWWKGSNRSWKRPGCRTCGSV